MPNRILLLLVVLVMTFFGMNFHCGKPIVDAKPFEQTFQVPVQVYPSKKTYSLADTIWIETAVPGKTLFDTKSNQMMGVDTGKIDFAAVFNRFGTDITSPPDGFCDIITSAGVNVERQLGQWSTTGSFSNYGCVQPDYKCRIGFKPKQRGTYFLTLFKDQLLGSCASKVVPYYASLAFTYQNPDLNVDVFNALPDEVTGGSSGKKFYLDKLANKEIFIVRVD